MNAKQPGTYAYEMFDTKDEKTRCGMADWIDTVEVNYDLDPQFEQNTVVAYEQYLQFGPMREDWKKSTSTDCECKRLWCCAPGGKNVRDHARLTTE